MISPFDLAAVFLALTAVIGWINTRFLRLPRSIAILMIGAGGAATLAGLPTVAVPAGFGPAGLPSGIQIIGPAQQDFAVLQLAHAYEQVSVEALARLPDLLTR